MAKQYRLRATIHGMPSPFARDVADRMQGLQDRITAGLESLAGGGRFHEDCWNYDRGKGGGRTRVMEGDTVFEKGGVNWSAIEGAELPAAALERKSAASNEAFFATGVSLVIHPQSPYVPTIHMNVRYVEAGMQAWFGGGIDLTPNYPDRSIAIAFHRGLQAICAPFGPTVYPEAKAACDRYFNLPHRGEMRGIGGIFFDHLSDDPPHNLAFAMAVGDAFLDLYSPIVRGGRDRTWGPRERDWQLLRRGRYAEFNLLWDRGTRFGIESGGRSESILMSLPAEARWSYNRSPAPGSPEAELVEDFLQPRDWASETP